MSSTHRLRTPRSLAVCAALLALLGGGGAWVAVQGGDAAPVIQRASLGTAPEPEIPFDLPNSGLGGVSEPAVIPQTGAAPTKLTLPGVQGILGAAIVPVGLNPDGSAEVPRDPATIGWYQPLGTPDGVGSDVLVGHVNYRGKPGAFANLHTVKVGQEASVGLPGAPTKRYKVTEVRTYPKYETPLKELYTPVGPERLVLITCGGEFDSLVGHYDSNVVVIAVPV